METDGQECQITTCPNYDKHFEFSCSLGEDEAYFEWCHRKKNGFIDHDAELFKGGLEGIKRKAVKEVVEAVKMRLNSEREDHVAMACESTLTYHNRFDSGFAAGLKRAKEILDEEVSRVNSGGARVERKEDEQNNHCAGTY